MDSTLSPAHPALTRPQPQAAHSGYRAVLATRHVPRLLGGTLIGRLPTGMVPLALLLHAHTHGTGTALAGVLTGGYGLASALGQPLLGRLVDRHGQAAVSVRAAWAAVIAFLLLAFLDPARHPAAAATAAVAAGLCTPPLEAGLRALWPTLLPDHRLRHTAFALDSSSQEIIYVAGPVLAGALATLASPASALVATAALGLLGTLLVTSCPPTRTRPARPHPAHRHSPPGLPVLFLAMTGVGVAVGAFNVLALDSAERHHAGWLAATLPAVLSTGSLIGGLAHGRRAWRGTPCGQLLAITAAFTLAWLPLLADPRPTLAVAWALLPGVFLAPLLTCTFLAVPGVGPSGLSAEACAWLVSGVGLGSAAGTALTGVVTAAGPLATAAVPMGGAAAALLVLAAFRRRLTMPR